MNIDYTDTLNEVAGRIDISAMSAHDAADLITVAENALKLGARGVLAPVDLVHTIWAWLENKGVSIFASIDVKIKKGREFDYVNLVQKISNVFKKGADGVVLMTEPGIVAELLSELNPVRGDLFFGKKLIIGFDLNDVNAHDWPGIFHEMRNIFADGLLLCKSADDADTDVAGRVFGMLDFYDDGSLPFVYFDLNNFKDIESVWRLIGKMRPSMIDRVRFFAK